MDIHELKLGAIKKKTSICLKKSILLVSTFDGKLIALDLRQYGKQLWSTSLTPERETSADLYHVGKIKQLVPSLNGDLYQFDGHSIHTQPIITAESWKKNTEIVYDSQKIVGRQERTSYLLLASTGELITSPVGKNGEHIIEITRIICDISVHSMNGENLAACHLVQYEIINSECPDYHARTIPKDYNLTFGVPTGSICCQRKRKKWTKSLSCPILSAWRINGNGTTTSINLFAKIQRELNNPIKELVPSFYIGLFKHQFKDNVYIQNLQSTKSLSVQHSRKEITFDVVCPATRTDTISAANLLEKSICYELFLSAMLTQPTTSSNTVMPPIFDQYKSTKEISNYQRSISEPIESRGSTKSPSHFSTHFNVIQCLGRGGFGVGVEAKNKVDSLNYAVKRILMPNRLEFRSRVLREVKTLPKCDHPNIIRYYNAWLEDANCQDNDIEQAIQELSSGPYDSYTESTSDRTSNKSIQFKNSTSLEIRFEEPSKNNGNDEIRLQEKSRIKKYLFIQMELCHSQSLAKYIRSSSVAERKPYIKSILQQIADGVQYIHQQGLIHRDLKPSNIYFSLQHHLIVKIGDFGLVTDMPDTENLMNASFSEQTQYAGTHLYMSPEQILKQPYDCKVDIFSMGVIYVELLIDFDTEMERIETLNGLKNGIIPKKFAKNNILKRMLTTKKEERPDIAEIQKLLNYDREINKKCNLPIGALFRSPLQFMGIVLLSNNVL